jgi:hypothetical protein
MREGDPIVEVYHDYDDGSWQFHGTRASSIKDSMLVCLSEVWELDSSIGELHDLLYGWRAFREMPGMPWHREKHHPYPTFAENGFYLEDAALYAEQVTLPSKEETENCKPGDFVKAVFRFAAEDAERQSMECERMWLLVEEADEEHGNYTGRLNNEPQCHDAIKCDDYLVFSPNHIIAIDRADGSRNDSTGASFI